MFVVFDEGSHVWSDCLFLAKLVFFAVFGAFFGQILKLSDVKCHVFEVACLKEVDVS